MCERTISDEINFKDFLRIAVHHCCTLLPKQNELHTPMPLLTTSTATYEGVLIVKRGQCFQNIFAYGFPHEGGGGIRTKSKTKNFCILYAIFTNPPPPKQ